MIGQIVQDCQASVSKDFRTCWRHIAGVSDEARFNEALCARVHRLRNERGWTSAQMAMALGVPPDRYRKYEYRSPLPHYLIERFALIVGREVEYVLTGRMTHIRSTPSETRAILA